MCAACSAEVIDDGEAWHPVDPSVAPPAGIELDRQGRGGLDVVGLPRRLADDGAPSAPRGDEHERVAEAQGRIAGGYGVADATGVVALALKDEGGRVVRTCSGALLARNVVFTAQHCVAERTNFVSCDNSSFSRPVAPHRLSVTPSPSMWSVDAAWHSVARIEVPDADRPDAPVCGYDVAVVVLRDPISDDVATPMAPRLSSHPLEGEEYSAIGYGNDEDGVSGIRRRRDGLRVRCVGEECEQRNVDFREWRGDTGICQGDSGGPAIDGAGFVMGVTSRGPSGCSHAVYGSTPSWGRWLQRIGAEAAAEAGFEAPPWTDPRLATAAESLTIDQWASCSLASVGAAGGRDARLLGAGIASLTLAYAACRTRRRSLAPKGA